MKESVRKVGQRFMVGFDGFEASLDVKRLIREYGVGHVIYFARNIASPEQVAGLSRELQECARDAGTAAQKASVLSFVIEGVHPHDAGSILDYEGVAVRTGHHCAQPVMDRFGVPATIRASLGVYNTREDIDVLVRGIRKVQEMFA